MERLNRKVIFPLSLTDISSRKIESVFCRVITDHDTGKTLGIFAVSSSKFETLSDCRNISESTSICVICLATRADELVAAERSIGRAFER